MNRKSLMSSGLDNESTRNKLKELALYDSETNETDLMKTQCVLFWCNSNGHYDASHGWIWSNTWNPKQWERRRKKHPDYCKEAKENVRGAIKTTDKDIAKTALLAKRISWSWESRSWGFIYSINLLWNKLIVYCYRKLPAKD